MNTETTPAVKRGAEALDVYVHVTAYPRDAVLREASCDALVAALTDPDDPDALARVLASHQVESRGMSHGSPDTCTCGVKALPAPYLASDPDHYEDVQSRRDRSFAAHQAAAVRAWLLGADL